MSLRQILKTSAITAFTAFFLSTAHADNLPLGIVCNDQHVVVSFSFDDVRSNAKSGVADVIVNDLGRPPFENDYEVYEYESKFIHQPSGVFDLENDKFTLHLAEAPTKDFLIGVLKPKGNLQSDAPIDLRCEIPTAPSKPTGFSAGN